MSTLVFDCTSSVESWISGLSAAYNGAADHHEKETLAAGVVIKAAPIKRIKQFPVLSAKGMCSLMIKDYSCSWACVILAASSSFMTVARMNTNNSGSTLSQDTLDEGLS